MIKFGTSGFRGVLGDNFTKNNVKRVAIALSQIIKKDKNKSAKVIIGFDNRFMSKEFSQWMGEVLSETAQVDIFTESVPSPTIAWFTKVYDFGVVITASHNPYMYNGIKIFKDAKECDDDLARRIENLANKLNLDGFKDTQYKEALKSGRIIEINNYKDYCDSLLSHFDVKKIKKSNIKILANCMHGNSVNCLNFLFKKLKLNYKLQNDNIDPYFEYKLPAPYVQNLVQQSKDVLSGGYDVGFAFDGDSDRFTLISSDGKVYDCNYVAAVLYYHFLKNKQIKGSVAKNIALSNLLKKISDDFKFQCYETKVGFKHIGKILEETDAFMGAESNGIAFKNHILTKDGIFVAIAVLELLTYFNKPFHKILEEIQKQYDFKSTVLEFAYPITEKKEKEITHLLFVKKGYPNFEDRKIINIDDREGLKINYENGYWGMIRFSGNEPVVRIFSEMKNKKECDKMFACYEKFLGVSERQ